MNRLSPLLVLGSLLPLAAVAEPASPEVALEDVQIVEHLGERVPLDLQFKDELGRTVALKDLVRGDRPVILSLVYYNCPMLCNLVLNGLVGGLRDLEWSPGAEFDIITVSISPQETPALAREKKASYLGQLGRPGAERGWHFLTGERAEIKRLADAVGFGYRYLPEKMDYAHGAALFLLSPEGHLTRYLYGVQFPQKQLRLGLTEAGHGKIGDTFDRLLLRCYRYDADSRAYGVHVWGVVRAGGLLTLVVLSFMLLVLWRRERRRGYGAFDAAQPDATRASGPGGVA